MKRDVDRGHPKLTAPRAEVERKLAGQISKGHGYRAVRPTSAEDLTVYRHKVNAWDRYNAALLRGSFSSDEVADEYQSAPSRPEKEPDSVAARVALLHEVLKERTRFLSQLMAELDTYEEPAAASVAPVKTQSEEEGSTIFIVHGHDRGAELEVVRFLERATNLRPVVLHDEPNRGRTIIEKFEQHAASATFAVVILTPDDEGRARGAPALKGRARQNVIFELGYFFGKLGRDHVAALYSPGTEHPSDINGLAYIELDRRGAWKTDLFRELRAARIEVRPEALVP